MPPGIADATVPNPIFNLTPVATVDEGNNWINMRWGPLSLTNPSVTGGANGNYGGGAPIGNYAMTLGSAAIDYIPTSSAGNFPSTDFFGNPRPDPLVPTRIDVGATEYQGSGVGTVASISPSSGAQGTVVPVTITGTLLTGTTAVTVSGGAAGADIVVSAVTVVNATTVTAVFTISPTATLSARTVTLTTPAGTTNAGTFTVVAPAVPTLTSIVPNSGLRGSATNVTLTGTNFTTGSTVNITAPGTGLSVSNVVVVSGTTITATLTSTTAATLGADTIYVVTPGGTSNTLPFTVTGPVLTSIAPASGLRGTAVNVTLTGTGLSGATAVTLSGGANVAITNIVVVSPTSITATFTIAATSATGAQNVTVTNAAGVSNAVTFTVTVPPGALTSIAPSTGARGTIVPVTLTGTNLAGTTAVTVSGAADITVTGITNVNATTVTATFTISATAALTARNVTVTTPAGVSTAVTFTVVLPGTPTLTSISPNFGLRGTTVPVTLTGTGFTAAGTTVNITAPANGVTVGPVTVVNATTITTSITSVIGSALGQRFISVVTPGGATGTVPFTVTGPALTSIAPVTGAANTTVPVTLFGSGLTGTTAITVSGTGITVTGLTVVAPGNQVNANFVIAAGTALTARNVTVNAPGGTSNAVTFTVFALPVPTLTSIAPASGVLGTAVPVTLTGTNLTGATAVTVSGTGVTVSNRVVQTATSVTATFTIAATAAPGARTVTITTPGGTSNTVPFTLQGATLTPPLTPNTGVLGASVNVTFTGNNLTGASAINGLGAGVTLAAGTLHVVSATSVTATLNIANVATLGIRNLGLVTPIGSTNTVPFTVQGATITFAGPVPALTTTPANTTTKTGLVTVTNATTATGPFTFTATPTAVRVSAGGGTYSVIAGGTCVSGAIVTPGGACTINVQYAPGTSTATAAGNVTITGTGAPTATVTSGNFAAN